MAITFADVEKVYGKWLKLSHDQDILRIIFATILANRYDGDRVWIILTGPPGSGKTALVNGPSESDECYAISALTPAALASGSTGTSFLDEVNNKIMIVRDMSSIASMPLESKSQLYSFLRDAYDGKFSRVTGRSATPIVWEGKFGFIGCSTPAAVDKDVTQNQELGERFLIVRLNIEESQIESIVRMKYKLSMEKSSMKEELSEISQAFLHEFIPMDITMPDHLENEIIELAMAIAAMRSGVSRDRQTREIDLSVDDTREIPTRLCGQLTSLSVGLIALGTNKKELLRVLRRATRDTVPINRSRIIKSIIRGNVNAQTISKDMKISSTTINREIESLDHLNVIGKSSGSVFIKNPVVLKIFS